MAKGKKSAPPSERTASGGQGTPEGDRAGRADADAKPREAGGAATTRLEAPSRSGPGLAWLGWTLAMLGALGAVALRGHGGETVAWICAALGAAMGFAGSALGLREAAPARTLSTLGTLLLLGGGAALVYPCVLTRDALVTLHEQASYVPALAVGAAFLGAALLVIALNRQGGLEPGFALEVGARAVSKLAELHPRRFFLETWRELDREAAEERAVRAAAGLTAYDWRPLVALCTGAVFLAAMEYFGHAPTLHELIDALDPPRRFGEPETLLGVVRESPFRRLSDFVWWSGWRVLGFFVLPAIVVKLVFRERLVDYGLSPAGFLRHAWIYVVFFGVVLVAVIVVSVTDEHFRDYYPFYKQASRSWYDFWAWELLYAAQFFSLEFFFRGFWLKAAKRSMGSHAIYAMVVPYCMIHFGKPFLETLAAILAGVVLGTLAMRTRSIWSGFLIHVSVAISMDLAVLVQTSGLPDRWWPAL